MTRDANDLARDHEIRTRRSREYQERVQVRGTLSLWDAVRDYATGEDPVVQSPGVTLDLSYPGMLLAYDAQGDCEIFTLSENQVFNFVPDRYAG